MSRIPALPASIMSDELIRALNERLRRIDSELGQRYRKGEDLDLAGNRIKNPGDPIDPTDAISRAAADRRYLNPRVISGSAAGAPGVAGSASVSATVVLSEYGVLTLENVAITGATGIGSFQSISAIVFYVDEMTTDVWGEINADVGTGDPLTVGVLFNGSRTTPTGELDFAEGQFVVFNDPAQFEIAKITDISGSTYQMQRSGQLGSTMTDHLAGTRFFIAQERKFTFAPAGADYDAVNDIITVPGTLDCVLPNACVVAVALSAQFGGDTGPHTIVNTGLAAVPGLRTLHGGNYQWQLAGTLSVGQSTTPKRVQYESSIRVAFTRVGTAPTGAALTIVIERSVNNGGAWSTIATLTVAAGSTESFDFSTDPPGPRRTPYSGAWPFPILNVDDMVRARVTTVGSSTAGANASVELYT